MFYKNSHSENSHKHLPSEKTRKSKIIITRVTRVTVAVLSSIILIHQNTTIKNFEALLEKNKLIIRIEEIIFD